MKYKVNVCSEPSWGYVTPWFSNFVSSIDYMHEYVDVLLQYNAVGIPGADYIEFDTEEDFLFFKLKFS